MNGVVKSSVNDYPLPGIRVEVFFVEEEPLAPLRLGEGISGIDGRFEIRFRDSVAVKQRVCLIEKCGGTYQLKVRSDSSENYFITKNRTRATSRDITVYVTPPDQSITAEVWRTIGTRLQESGIVQLNQLVRQLLLMDTHTSIFGDLTLETRHAAVAELEAAFLDPDGSLKAAGPVPNLHELRDPGALANYVQATRRSNEQLGPPLNELIGKVSAFDTLSSVDWAIDTAALTSGHVAEALKKFQPSYRAGDFASRQIHVSIIPPDKNLINYRNYLRTIFTGAPNSPDYAQHLNELANRFHQDLTTIDTRPTSANWIAGSILTSILTAPVPDYGFGLAPNTIQPKGERTDREYLDYLIGLTNLPLNEIALRYRLTLDRRDGEISNRVSENIYTLQHFYSDGFQSSPDPSPIIPSDVLGKSPFYLEYEEWYRLNGPFYGENYYEIRQTHFFDYDTDTRETIKLWATSDASDYLLDGGRWMAKLLAIDDTLSQAHSKLDVGLYTQATELYIQALAMTESALVMPLKPVDAGTDNYRLVLEKGKKFYPEDVVTPLADQFTELLSFLVAHPNDLDWSKYTIEDPLNNFANFYRIYYLQSYYYLLHPDLNAREFMHFVADEYYRLQLILLHLYLYVIPTCLGDTTMAAGDYVQAESFYALTTAFVVGKGELSMSTGYRQIDFEGSESHPQNVHDATASPVPVLLQKGVSPYSADTSKRPGYDFFLPPIVLGTFQSLGRLVIPSKTHPMEKKFFALRHGGSVTRMGRRALSNGR